MIVNEEEKDVVVACFKISYNLPGRTDEAMAYFSQDSQNVGRESNPESPEHESY
jgi:hypothetical protein